MPLIGLLGREAAAGDGGEESSLCWPTLSHGTDLGRSAAEWREGQRGTRQA